MAETHSEIEEFLYCYYDPLEAGKTPYFNKHRKKWLTLDPLLPLSERTGKLSCVVINGEAVWSDG